MVMVVVARDFWNGSMRLFFKKNEILVNLLVKSGRSNLIHSGSGGAHFFGTSQIVLNVARVAGFFPCINANCANTAAVTVTCFIFAAEVIDKDFAIPTHKIMILIRPNFWLASTIV